MSTVNARVPKLIQRPQGTKIPGLHRSSPFYDGNASGWAPNSLVYNVFSWFIMVCYGLSWLIIVYHGLSWFIIVDHCLLWFIVVYHGLSLFYYDLLWFIMDYHCFTMIYYGSSWLIMAYYGLL